MTSILQASLPSVAYALTWVRRLPGRAGTLLARWHDRYIQRLALAELDDRLLADIGISAEEARRECAQPFWRPKANMLSD